MWPFKKRSPASVEADTVHASVIPFKEDVDPIFLGKTEVIPRITRDEPDTAVIELDTDDQNLADWEAELLADREKRQENPPNVVVLDEGPSHLPTTFWAISKDGEHRVYFSSRGIKSALTQLEWHQDGDVWQGAVFWAKVTPDYVERSA